MKTESKKFDRRNWLSSVLRWSTAMGFASLGVFSILKRKKAPKTSSCINQGICQKCGVFKDCSLPQALCAKEHLKKKHNG